MGSVYVIKPENGQFLSQLSPDPILENVKIVQIDVDSANQCWTVWLEGEKRGTEEFWDQLAAQLCAAVGTIDKVTFAWKGNQQHTEDEINYMHSVIKNFNPTAGSREEKQKNPKAKRKKGRRKEQPINTEHVPIASIDVEQNDVVIAGEVVAVDKRTLRTGRILVTFDVWDHTDTITCKLFLELDEEVPPITVGEWLKVKGNVQFQSYEQELALTVQQFNRIPPPPPVEDQAPQKRVELHLHTKMSGLDGVTDVEEVVRQAALWGHPAVAITDHGVVQAFPAACAAGKKHGIKIIYGLEGYLIDNDTDRPHHIVILAKNKTGLKNLYKLVSYSHLHHFYRRPRIPRKLLIDHREGLILGSACEQGEVFQACLRKDPRLKEIARFYDYLEIQPLGNNEFLIGTSLVSSLEDLQEINRTICEVGQELGLPVVATGDVHFLRPEDGVYRTILLQGQGFEDVERPAPLYFRTTDEMLGEFKYLGEELARKVVITDPNKIASQIEELVPIPQGLHAPKIPAAAEQLQEVCYKTARELYGDPLPDLVARRLEKELNAIIGNGYAALYWTARQLVLKSNSDGYMVGSRGSVGSSFVATMSGITEVNPLPPHYICPKCHWHKFFTGEEVGAGIDLPKKDCPRCGTELHRDGFDIPFEVFLGFDGDKVPDIDLNFSGEYQATIQKYTEELFGADYVFRAGTIGTLAEKTAYGFVKNYLDERNIVATNAEINRLVKGCTGVKRTTGQHPGGVMIVPQDREIYEFCPIQYPADDSTSGTITTHFDYHSISGRLLKLDILGHDDPTVIRMLEDLTGVNARTIPIGEKKTMGIFSSTEPLGINPEDINSPVGTFAIPEFGTKFVRQMLVDTKPKTFSELIRISGLSHGTDVWLNNAQDLVRSNIASLSEVICTRDDIMLNLIHYGLPNKTAFKIMEDVRKGKGLKEEYEQIMREKNVPDWYIGSCKKIKYMFPKAHAAAYVMMAFRIAWFKVYYPEAFYATYFTVRADEFDAAMMCHGKDRVINKIREFELKGNNMTQKEKNTLTILEVANEMYARGIKFLPIDIYKSDAVKFKIEKDGLRPPLNALQGLGTSAAQSIVEARNNGEFISVDDLRIRAKVSKTVIEILQQSGCLDGLPESNQISLFG